MLHLCYKYVREVTEAYDTYNFAKVASAAMYFINTELSSFYFELLKDRLYADAPASLNRRSAQTTIAVVGVCILKVTNLTMMIRRWRS